MTQISLEPIGFVESPYKEKFAIPRQPGLVPAAHGKILLIGDVNNEDAVKGLEQFSHVWVTFHFHATQAQGWKPLVRPPRLGGNEKLGVLATRSTFRPNPIGLSVVKLEGIESVNGQVSLTISALDLLDGTPVLDIKPYIPYADSIESASAGFAQHEPDNQCDVIFSQQANTQLKKIQDSQLKSLITQVLKQDPRPAYKRSKLDNKQYGMALKTYNIVWHMLNLESIEVLSIEGVDNAC